MLRQDIPDVYQVQTRHTSHIYETSQPKEAVCLHAFGSLLASVLSPVIICLPTWEQFFSMFVSTHKYHKTWNIPWRCLKPAKGTRGVFRMHQTLAAQMCSCMGGPVATKKVLNPSFDITDSLNKKYFWPPGWCTNRQWRPLQVPKVRRPLWQFPARSALQSGSESPGWSRWQGKPGELAARAAFPEKYTPLADIPIPSWQSSKGNKGSWMWFFSWGFWLLTLSMSSWSPCIPRGR